MRASWGVVVQDDAVGPVPVNIYVDVAASHFFLEDVLVPVDIM